MSVYERYDETSRHYDATRLPVGAEIILGSLARHAKPLGELVVLDAGCGTGAYARAIVERVGRIEALDLSRGMLARARAKLAAEAAAGRVGFHVGPVTDLPFSAGSFDGVMINQVAHHLGDGPEDGFAGLARVRALEAAGRLEAFVAEHDARRPVLGQVTFVVASRP